MAKPRADADQTQQRRHHLLPWADSVFRWRMQKYDDACDVRRSRGLRSEDESVDEFRFASPPASCACGRHCQGHRLFYRREQRLRRRRSVQGGIQLSSSLMFLTARVRGRRVGFVVRRLLPVLFLSAALIACTTPAHDDRIAAASPALNDLTSFALMRIDQGARSSAVLSVEQFADALRDYD